MIKKYRRKPVIMEAIKFEYTSECIALMYEFGGKSMIAINKHRHPFAKGWAEIGTLEDGSDETARVKHIATEGDYIVKGVTGEIWAVKPDIFEATYEEVEE